MISFIIIQENCVLVSHLPGMEVQGWMGDENDFILCENVDQWVTVHYKTHQIMQLDMYNLFQEMYLSIKVGKGL